jgi:hypothetical protein
VKIAAAHLAGVIFALRHGMRTRIWLIVVVVMILAIVPAASALPFALAVVPIAIVEPGSLLLLGLTLLTLAGVAQRILS